MWKICWPAVIESAVGRSASSERTRCTSRRALRRRVLRRQCSPSAASAACSSRSMLALSGVFAWQPRPSSACAPVESRHARLSATLRLPRHARRRWERRESRPRRLAPRSRHVTLVCAAGVRPSPLRPRALPSGAWSPCFAASRRRFAMRRCVRRRRQRACRQAPAGLPAPRSRMDSECRGRRRLRAVSAFGACRWRRRAPPSQSVRSRRVPSRSRLSPWGGLALRCLGLMRVGLRRLGRVGTRPLGPRPQCASALGASAGGASRLEASVSAVWPFRRGRLGLRCFGLRALPAAAVPCRWISASTCCSSAFASALPLLAARSRPIVRRLHVLRDAAAFAIELAHGQLCVKAGRPPPPWRSAAHLPRRSSPGPRPACIGSRG